MGGRNPAYLLQPEKPEIKGNKMRKNKYIYGWKIYVNYGQGWEYETFEETFAKMKENRKAYTKNCQYPFKITKGRELND